MGGAWRCALHNIVSNDDLYIVYNALWAAFLFLKALKQSTVMTNNLKAARIHINSTSMLKYRPQIVKIQMSDNNLFIWRN